jgi:spore germination protein YaaH
VPYYTLDSLAPADLADASEIVYSAVCPSTNGAIDSSGSPDCVHGYADLATTTVANLIANAHADHDRVLLSVETTDDSVIESIDAHPASVAKTLAANLVALERLHGFDGTNIDFEGTNPADRGGYVRFVTAFTKALRADDPTGEIILNSYADSAAGSASFFDPAKLAPLVDALFVMNYSLETAGQASAGSPFVTNDLGYSAVQTLLEYEKLVPANKIILGVPFYGLDFTTATDRPGSTTTAAAPQAELYSSIEKAGYPALWDPATETPYSRFRRDGAWHQLWFDDPVSLALKVALASDLHTAGVGAWAFGMENGNAQMLEALTGDRPPLRTSLAR